MRNKFESPGPVESGGAEDKEKENEARKKDLIKEFSDRIREKILEGLAEFLLGEDPELKEFQRKSEASLEIGRRAHEFYRSLIPQSLEPAEKNVPRTSRHEESFERARAILAERLRGQKTLAPLAEREHFIKSALEGEFRGEVEETTADDGTIEQWIYNRFFQEGGINVIEETVANKLYPREGVNSPFARFLLAQDRETGIGINLGQLLPPKYDFAPDDLVRYQKDRDPNTGEPIARGILTDLRSYKGTRGSEGNFNEIKPLRLITYGDLTKRGNLLSLLHETSHAWQDSYYKGHARSEFEGFYENVIHALEVIRIIHGAAPFGEDEKKERRGYLRANERDLKKRGVTVTIPEENLSGETDRPLKQGEWRIHSPEGEHSFIVKSKQLEPLLERYERQERNAWAHAVRVLRFLRARGVDLEPSLKTAADFKAYIHPCLDSYQEEVSAHVESSERKLRFTRRKDEPGGNP